MTTPPLPIGDALFQKMEEFGFDRNKDAILFEWAGRWAFSNQFMTVSDEEFFILFMDSYGVSLYREHGIVPDDED